MQEILNLYDYLRLLALLVPDVNRLLLPVAAVVVRVLRLGATQELHP